MTNPATPARPAAPASDNRAVMIVLAYLWPLALVPLLVEKSDAEVRWHARHGIVLMIAEVAFLMAWSFFVSLVWVIAGPLGCLFYLLSPLLFLAILAVHVAAIVRAVNGHRLVIPHLSEFANRF